MQHFFQLLRQIYYDTSVNSIQAGLLTKSQPWICFRIRTEVSPSFYMKHSFSSFCSLATNKQSCQYETSQTQRGRIEWIDPRKPHWPPLF